MYSASTTAVPHLKIKIKVQMSVEYKFRNDAPPCACSHRAQDSRVPMCVFCGNAASRCVNLMSRKCLRIRILLCVLLYTLLNRTGFALLLSVFNGNIVVFFNRLVWPLDYDSV